MIKLNKSIIKDVYVISSLKHKDKEVFSETFNFKIFLRVFLKINLY